VVVEVVVMVHQELQEQLTLAVVVEVLVQEDLLEQVEQVDQE
jgi:hypothetical protein|tara:strand:+ start:563 stop:688 length:126 start_codon:yes stop_codon:yes gene_type:complete